MLTVGIFLFQNKTAQIEASCATTPDQTPYSISCTVSNLGRADAEGVVVAFNNSLPLETRLLAKPEYGLSLKEADYLPDPYREPEASKIRRAFSIFIPRVQSKGAIHFILTTSNRDNVRAGKQVLYLWERALIRLEAAHKKIEQIHPKRLHGLTKEHFAAARIKKLNFFTPAKVAYQGKIQDVLFINQAEAIANAFHSDLFHEMKGVFQSAESDTRNTAPVIRIKTSKGEGTYALMPAYTKVLSKSRVSMKDVLTQKNRIGQVYTHVFYPSVPEKYEFENDR